MLGETLKMVSINERKSYLHEALTIRRDLWKVRSSHFLKPAGLVGCACWNSHTTYGWRRSGFLMIIVSVLMGIAMILPYIVAVSKQLMPAFLPFISQAGGTPPMTGIFAVPLSFLGFAGTLPFVLFYASINHRNIRESKKISTLNKIALFFILICCLGCVITAANPIGFTQESSKFEWIVTVLFEHGVGACMILFGVALFQFTITGLWFLLPDATKMAKYVKVMMSLGFFIIFLTCIKPMPDHLYEELGPEPFNIPMLKNSSYDLPLVFTTSYKISAVCEWIACLLAFVNFLTLFNDLQRISVHVVLRHKSCFSDILEPVPSITLKTLS